MQGPAITYSDLAVNEYGHLALAFETLFHNVRPQLPLGMQGGASSPQQASHPWGQACAWPRGFVLFHPTTALPNLATPAAAAPMELMADYHGLACHTGCMHRHGAACKACVCV